MPDLGPTSFMDPLVESWAVEAGMETKTLASMVGGNILGGVVKVPLDMFLTDLGGKIVSTLIGAVSLLFGTYTLKGQGRLQLDTMQFGSRMITEILDPSPDQIKGLQKNVGDFLDGWVQGRWDKVLYSFVRNPRELTGILPAPEKKEQPAADKQPGQPQPPPPAAIVIRL